MKKHQEQRGIKGQNNIYICKKLISKQFRYAQLKEIELDQCREKYDNFLRRSRKKALLTENQLCAGDDKVRNQIDSGRVSETLRTSST